MTDPVNSGETEDRINHRFFSALLAINIVFFVAIAVLEYRAFRLSKLRGHEAGFAVSVGRPDTPHSEELWRRASAEARAAFANGAEAFRNCALCHGLSTVERNYGPNLKCVTERRIANAEDLPNGDYRFSRALIQASERYENWTLPTLTRFVADPSEFDIDESGERLRTRMPFPGLAPCRANGERCRPPYQRSQKAIQILRDVTQYLYWSCHSAPDLEDLTIVSFDDEGNCVTRELTEQSLDKRSSDRKSLLLPVALAECPKSADK